MKKAYIIAYCRQNLGDDMFLRSLVRRYPHIAFQCNVPPAFSRAFQQEVNLKTPGRFHSLCLRAGNKLGLLSTNDYRRIMAKRSDMVVRIGGSIFIEKSGSKKRSWENYHEKEFIIGANFGPYHSAAFVEQAAAFFRGCADVCFRDRYSRELFRQLPQVRQAPDILFGYPGYPAPQAGRGVGISLISLAGRPGLAAHAQTFYSVLARVCDLLVSREIPVTLFAFCSPEGDMEATDAVLARAARRNQIRVKAYDGDIDGMLAELNRCETIIATRFHAMILGWAMGKKVLPVLYSPKQAHVIEDLSYTGFVWDLETGAPPAPEALVQACLDAQPLPDRELLAREAEKQFQVLDAHIAQTGTPGR